MTTEQVIEVLSEIRSGYNCFDDLEKPFYHALSMAIEALTHFNSTSNSIKNELNELSCSAFPNSSEPKTAESGSVEKEMPEIKTDRTNDGLIWKRDAMNIANTLRDCISVDGYWAWIERLKNLPSAQPEQGCEKCIFKPFKQFQPEQRWIPCSERLPENGHYYLWCSDMGHVQSDYYWNGFEDGMKYGYNIVAWMPLPEPYRGE